MDSNTTKKFTVLMALGTFVVVLDNTIMNVSIQALIKDLGTTVSGVQAAIALNALMMAAFVLFGGKLADIVGMKRTFMSGVFLYIAGSLTASFSNSLGIFIIGWCLIQGFGAALMLPNVQTLIRAFLAGDLRARAYGIMSGVNALAAAMGPVIGGFLTTYFSWRWAFRLEVITLLILLFCHRYIPKDKPIAHKEKIDYLGLFLQAFAMICIVLGVLLISDFGLILAKNPLMIAGQEISLFGLGLSPSIVLLAIGTIALLVFIRVQTKKIANHQASLLHPALFKIKDFVQGLKVRTLQLFVVSGLLFSIPLFMQVTFGISAFQTGIAILPLSISLALGSIAGVRLLKWYYPTSIIKLGAFILTLGGLVLMARVNSSTQPIELSLGLIVIGAGIALIGSQIVNLILSSVTAKETAEASGITSTLEQVGSSMGVAILGTILTVTLSLSLSNQLGKNTTLPEQTKKEAQTIVEKGVEVVSDAQIKSGLSKYDEQTTDEVLSIYKTSRTNAFRILMLFVAFIGLITFIFSGALPMKKVTSAEGT